MSLKATMLSRGRLQLPQELIEAKGWTAETWFEITDEPGGVVLREVPAPEAPEAIRKVFSRVLRPLGMGRGEAHNKYVYRWRHRSGAVIVNEAAQPNVWLARHLFERLEPGLPKLEVKTFSPASRNPGFHSNVAATPGLKGQDVAKLRAERPDVAAELANAIVRELERLA